MTSDTVALRLLRTASRIMACWSRDTDAAVNRNKTNSEIEYRKKTEKKKNDNRG
jgi:hypothetical protein